MIVMLDDSPVRFTDDGKLFIIDAITALSGDDDPQAVWNEIIQKESDIKQYIEYQTLPDRQKHPVTDSLGWEQIQKYLFKRVTEKEAEAM